MLQFTLSESQIKKLDKWRKHHKCSIKAQYGIEKYVGAVGGELTYHFTPTSIGSVVTVSCSCGKKIDITEDF